MTEGLPVVLAVGVKFTQYKANLSKARGSAAVSTAPGLCCHHVCGVTSQNVTLFLSSPRKRHRARSPEAGRVATRKGRAPWGERVAGLTFVFLPLRSSRAGLFFVFLSPEREETFFVVFREGLV